MANSLVICKSTSLAKRNREHRAAQYVRMSTDHQRFSIQNQAATIAAFAQQKNLTIVRTFVDAGKSGVRISGRAGLIELMDCVCSGEADFDHILVYDVSRWGRFQGVDESAHYEFLCKKNGIKVVYCAEQFENDGSLLSSIVKNLKRVMAAEFSRELGVKVHAGQCRSASLGYRAGGSLGFGLRRELVDEAERSKGWLAKGEQKALKTDRVRLRLGSRNEAAIVKWIFDQFVIERKSDAEIARELNGETVPNHTGRLWSAGMVHTLVQNENFVGNLVYNRRSRRLGQKQVNNPPDCWIRRDGVFTPIVDRDIFARAQKIVAERRLEIPDDQMLRRLRILLARKGKLNSRLINGTLGVSCVSALARHFGSLRKAYALIGYSPKRDSDWIDARQRWADVLVSQTSKVCKALSSRHMKVEIDDDNISITVNAKIRLCFQVVRQIRKKAPRHTATWRVRRRRNRSGLLVILRLNDTNRVIEDYVVLPASKITKDYLTLSETTDPVGTCKTMAELVACIRAGANVQPDGGVDPV